MKPSRSTLFLACFGALVLAGIAAGLSKLDSPGEARLRRLDEARIDDLQTLAREVKSHWRTHGVLLPGLTAESAIKYNVNQHLKDPETKTPYEYRVLEKDAFELCATFGTTLDNSPDHRTHNDFWRHGPGRTCFRFQADAPPKY